MENNLYEQFIQRQPYSMQELQLPPATYSNFSSPVQPSINHQMQNYNEKSALQKIGKQKSENNIAIQPKTKKISKKTQLSKTPSLQPQKGKNIKQFMNAQTPVLSNMLSKAYENSQIPQMPGSYLDNRLNSLTMLISQLNISNYPWQLQRAFQNHLSFDEMVLVINQLDTPIGTNQFAEGINRMKGLSTLQENILEKQIEERFQDEKQEKLNQLNELKILKGHKIMLKKNLEAIIAKNFSQINQSENQQHYQFQSLQYLPQSQQQQQQQSQQQKNLQNNYLNCFDKLQSIRYVERNNMRKSQQNKGVTQNLINEKFSELNAPICPKEQSIFQESNQNYDQPEISSSKRKVSDLFNELCNRNSNQLENQFNLEEIQQSEQPYQQPPFLETNFATDAFLQDKFFNNEPDYF